MWRRCLDNGFVWQNEGWRKGAAVHPDDAQGNAVVGAGVLKRRVGCDDHGVAPSGFVQFFPLYIIIFILGCEKTTFGPRVLLSRRNSL